MLALTAVTLVALSANPQAPTPMDEVERVLATLKLDKDDVVYDLGCGDGRVCIMASMKFGCRAVGIEIDQQKVDLAWRAVRLNKMEKLVAIYRRDLLKVDLAKMRGTVFYMYLPQELILEMMPQLRQCRGVKIVSYIHPLPITPIAKEGNFFIYEIPK